jgi:integrase
MNRPLYLVGPSRSGGAGGATERDVAGVVSGGDVDRLSELTVGEYLAGWLAGRQALRDSTRVSYAFHIRRYLIPGLGALLLTGLRPEHIEEAYRQILAANHGRARPVSAATLHRVHATLMSALSHAVRRGLLTRNPAVTVELARSVRSERRVWSGAELGSFLELIKDDPLYELYLTLGLVGLRRGEALGLRWSDVDFDAGLLRVQRQIVQVNGRAVEGPPKSAAGHRTVAIPARLDSALRWHQCDQVTRHAQPADGIQTRQVFSRAGGGGWAPAYVSRHFDRLVYRHGLARIRLHDLRHTSASIGLASGETLLEVSRRLGHSSITITGDIYSHVSPDTARASAERLARSLDQHR